MTTGQPASRHGGAGLTLIAALGVLFALLALAWMLVLPRVVSRVVRDRTGFDVAMRSLYVNPFTGRLKIEGLTITNPPDYPRKDFLDVPELRIDARPRSLFSGTLKVDDATVHLSSVTLVRDGRGRVNAGRFEEGRSEPTPAPRAGHGGAKAGRSFWIGRLELQVDRVVVADYSGGQAHVRTFDVNFRRTFTDVSGLQGLAVPAAEVLARTGTEAQGLLPKAGSLLQEAGQRLREAGRKTGAAVKGLFESLEKKLRN